jgi:hypothetical protein
LASEAAIAIAIAVISPHSSSDDIAVPKSFYNRLMRLADFREADTSPREWLLSIFGRPQMERSLASN